MAAGLIAVLTVTVLMARREPEPSGARDPDLIAAAVEAYSAGNLVLPGGEGASTHPTSSRRGPPPDSAINAAAEAAWRTYVADPTRTDRGIEAIAGLLAIGKTGLAGDRLQLFQNHHPQDVDGLLLEAAVSHAHGRSDEAMTILKRVASDDPARAELAELDLGIVLRATGNPGAAEQMFRRLADEARDERIRRRAAQEIEPSQ